MVRSNGRALPSSLVVDEQAQAPGPDGPEAAVPAPPPGGGADGAGSEPDGDGVPAAPGATPVLLRRAPRYRAFVLTGVVVGLIATGVILTVFPLNTDYLVRTVLTFGIGLGLVGGLLGVGAALLLERRPPR